jgi:hypothetical protein
MSGKLSSLSRRLAKLEQQRADRAMREELANCICGTKMAFRVFSNASEFEEEMNRTCPVHGVRRLGPIITMGAANPDGTPSEELLKLMRLMETYNLRLSQLSHSSDELEKNES